MGNINVPERLKIVSVCASSKKAGKSSLAAYLVGRLPASYGLKVSSGKGDHPGKPIVTRRRVIREPGTDTGALIKAGAGKVLWVRAEGAELEKQLERALVKFRSGGVLVTEGNSVPSLIDVDFAVFVMAVPPAEFKPSALRALPEADLVLVDRGGSLKGTDRKSLLAELHVEAPRAKILFYRDREGRELAFEETLRTARRYLHEKGSGAP